MRKDTRLHRLMYASVARPGINWDEISGILQSATANNQRNGLTGALFFGNGHFLQLLEGGRRELTETFDRILADERHSQVSLIEFVECDERQFGDWAMRFLEHQPRKIVSTIGDGFDPMSWNAEQSYSFFLKYNAITGVA